MNRVSMAVLAGGFVLLGFGLAQAVHSEQRPKPNERQQRESVTIRLAQSQVALAEANLKRLQDMNAKVTNAVSAELITSYSQDLAVAKLNLQTAMAGGEDFDVWLRRAEADSRYADTQYKISAHVNELAPGTVNAIDLERKRLRAQVAQLLLERGQLAKGSPPAEAAWRLSLIADEIQTLREEVRQTVPSSPIYPLWRY